MNLSDWIEKLSSRINLTVTQPGVGVTHGTETFTSTHTYENFTIAAAIVPTATTEHQLLPLVYYEPNDPNAARPKLVLRSQKPDPLQLSGETCDVFITDSDKQVWWYDLRGLTEAEPRAYFHYAHNPLDGSIDYSKYKTSLCHKNGRRYLEFNLEEATLYIGYDPDNSGNDSDEERTFTGAIDGILIDPTDSKPEKS